MVRRILRASLIILGALVLANLLFWAYREAPAVGSRDGLSDLPDVMLWAWERPEDLRFLDCGQAGVAYLAETVIVDHGGMALRPRLQPLLIPEGCPVLAVVRVEAAEGAPLAGRAGEVAGEIAATAEGVGAVQVDFDALASQRAFYVELLDELRQRLPAEVRLSMTALASWCIHDDWIRELPVEEAVPMLFRMGAEDREVRRYLKAGADFRVQACGHSLGVSTDEPWPELPRGRRLYVFHPIPWDEDAFAELLKRKGR